MSLPTVFVCGATGTQGGAVARHLRAKGAEVHALVRDPSSPKAKAIESLGVKTWHGDFDNEDALKKAIAGCSAVFLNFMPDFTDLSANLRQAKSILSIAKDAGVKHVVYTSGFGPGVAEKSPSWDPEGIIALILASKKDIEAETRASGLKYWTILRPGNFMANYIDPFVRMYDGLVEKGTWFTALSEETVLPMVDTETIGAFSTAALLDPERFHEKEISYADEMITLGYILKKLSEVTGRELRAVTLSEDEIQEQSKTNKSITAQLVMRHMSDLVDIDEVKKWGIPLSTFDAFVEREKARVLATYVKSS